MPASPWATPPGPPSCCGRALEGGGPGRVITAAYALTVIPVRPARAAAPSLAADEENAAAPPVTLPRSPGPVWTCVADEQRLPAAPTAPVQPPAITAAASTR